LPFLKVRLDFRFCSGTFSKQSDWLCLVTWPAVGQSRCLILEQLNYLVVYEWYSDYLTNAVAPNLFGSSSDIL